ncbi:MAG TPA: hypothetical protein DHV36_19490, partial [Desulfobacteraceae bacterium]|nr:hypothetical protein [Desulfobacteraceae bacterium]
MGNPLQDQLLKAGLVDKKQVNKAKLEKRKKRKKKKGSKPSHAPSHTHIHKNARVGSWFVCIPVLCSTSNHAAVVDDATRPAGALPKGWSGSGLISWNP